MAQSNHSLLPWSEWSEEDWAQFRLEQILIHDLICGAERTDLPAVLEDLGLGSGAVMEVRDREVVPDLVLLRELESMSDPELQVAAQDPRYAEVIFKVQGLSALTPEHLAIVAGRFCSHAELARHMCDELGVEWSRPNNPKQ